MKTISLDADYSFHKYFHKLFSRQYGMSPSAFKRLPQLRLENPAELNTAV